MPASSHLSKTHPSKTHPSKTHPSKTYSADLVSPRCFRQSRYAWSRYAKAIACIPLLSLALAGCSEPTGNGDVAADAVDSGPGTLVVRANGEDFVRDGFTGKDGWAIAFDHLYVTLADVTAFQSDPPFEPDKGGVLEAKVQVSADSPVTVDIAAGDEPTKAVEMADAPSGRYNALGWQLVPATSGPAVGYPLMLIGTATKGDESVAFEVGLDAAIAYTCGDFIGDERKGILSAGETAEVEATFHFDHLFGDAEAPADDELNVSALGFGPLAALAQSGQLKIDSQGLEEQLSAEDYQTLQGVFPGLGHVGEGHCESKILATQ